MIPFDSGKTTLSLQLAEYLISQGQRVEYFKPVSGHNYWYHYDHTAACIESGQLVSFDAARVRDVIGSRVPPQVANPVHSLFVPARLERPSRYHFNTLGLAGWDSFLAIQRISVFENGRIKTMMAVAKDLIDKKQIILTQEEMAALTADAEVVPISSLEEARAFECDHFETAINRAFSETARESDFVIIESFNDSVWPWEGLVDVDGVLLVGPGQAFAFDPDKTRKAAFLTKRGAAPIREVTFTRIDDLLRPIERYELHPKDGLGTKEIEKITGL